MAGGAVARHRGGLFEQVPVNEATADRTRLADMAVTACGVATGAVVAKHFLHGRIIVGSASRYHRGPIAFLRCM